MRIIITFLALCLAAVSAVPSISQRIVGGELTTIDKYPSMASLVLSLKEGTSICGGTILNDRSILTAAHCIEGLEPKDIISRVGSSFISSDGVVHKISSIIMHPSYDNKTIDSDIAILRTATTMKFNDVVKPVSIAGADYSLGDNEKVRSAGWGTTSHASYSNQLRQVEVKTISQTDCQKRYKVSHFRVTDNMLCAGLLDVGGRDACQGDSGGPLYHNNVQVGVVSSGAGCATAHFPGLYTRVSLFANWIKSNQ